MPGALVYTDDALNIVFCNDRFREMYEAPSALLQPGRAYPDFLRFLAEHGYYGPGDIDAPVAKRVESLRNPSGRTFEDRTPSGRMYRIRRSRVATGGVVTVMTDITEQKKAEEDIAAKEARFHLAPNNPLHRQPGLQPACVALPATTASRPGEHLNLRDRQGEPLLASSEGPVLARCRRLGRRSGLTAMILTIDSQIEHGQVARRRTNPELGVDRPNVLWPLAKVLANPLALVHRWALRHHAISLFCMIIPRGVGGGQDAA
jgi:hypothetical protein